MAGVDVEMVVCQRLRDALPDVEVGTSLVGWTAGTRHVLVRRTGGRLRYSWLDEADVMIEVRAESREAATALTGDVRAALGGFAEHQPATAVVSAVTETRGPGWLPEGDGAGRFRSTWQIKTHPRSGG